MKNSRTPVFDVKAYRASAGPARTAAPFQPKTTIFAQSHSSQQVMYIQGRRMKLPALNEVGSKAVVAILGPREFAGDTGLSGQKSTEKRIARTFRLVARCEKKDQPEKLIPQNIAQTPTEMIGTTRSMIELSCEQIQESGFIHNNVSDQQFTREGCITRLTGNGQVVWLNFSIMEVSLETNEDDMTDTYDLFKEDEAGAPVWVEAAAGRHQVKKRLARLMALKLGTYRIHDLTQREFVEPFTQSL